METFETVQLTGTVEMERVEFKTQHKQRNQTHAQFQVIFLRNVGI